MGSYTPAPIISRVAIIGAGPVGLAFAKFLLAEKAFHKIQIFEQRDRVGGIWNLSERTRTKQIPVPQLNPRYGQKAIQSWHKDDKVKANENANGKDDIDGPGQQEVEQSLEFESPLYDYLETNIPKTLMAYSDKPFSEDLPLFPHHEDVLKYIEEYAEDIKHMIKFGTEITSVGVNPRGPDGSDEWTIENRNLGTGSIEVENYDAVVVANGHYTVPSVPDIKGVQQWNTAYPGSIIHSKAYRRPEDYIGKKVLVIGNSASGLDIAFQIGQRCKQPVLLSSRSVSAFGSAPKAAWRKDVDEVVEFLDPQEAHRAIRLASGSIEPDIDNVVFCTGYFYSYPFLKDIAPPVISNGLRTKNTYEHLFNIYHPSLVFPVINLKVVPFPLAENQAAVVARVWSGRLSLPSGDEMRMWEEQNIKQKGNGKYFHSQKFPEDAAQMNELYSWAEQATSAPGLEGNGQGRLGMKWNDRHVYLRSQFPNIKAAYQKNGLDRTQVKTTGELGFNFDKWRGQATEEDLELFRKAKC